MKKIIIFGATGNVGAYVLKYAREYFNPEEYEVIASGRRRTDFFEKQGIPYYSVGYQNMCHFIQFYNFLKQTKYGSKSLFPGKRLISGKTTLFPGRRPYFPTISAVSINSYGVVWYT